MLSDTYAAWSQSLGLHLDLTDKGLGIRTARFAIIVDDLVIKYIKVRLNPMIGRSFGLTRDFLFSHVRLSLGQESLSPEPMLSSPISRIRIAHSKQPYEPLEITES